MKFTNTLRIAVLAIAGLAQALSDGFYEGTTFSNGTMSVKQLGATEAKRFTIEPPSGWEGTLQERDLVEGEAASRLGKRFVDCWGNALDHSGTDSAVQDWKNHVGANGQHYLESGNSPNWVGYIREAVLVYYCINAPHSSGSLDLVDINYALSQMDAVCVRYTASYFRWDGSVEIFGKVQQGVPICLG
ncbi:hypothetical protein CkaCkLH20_12109 [Colletotrichum karsti]|uniref:Ecp2 effector protein domain-containing protein n=1 Tax=Colletotrichum karsti TaxID=1095194 RepID=A0A9P6HV36_9PEZI|nr:uncharacterized protein CkaCkLH20_12109 [Colletotrichum karsti]KAF9870442.1 hypothetical protein CkaCkLH20_12109 [Colletotrichum karsti]